MSMTRDEGVPLILQRLGNRTDLTDAIITEMQLCQEDLLEQESELPEFLLDRTSYTTPLATVANQRHLALATNFLREWPYGKVEIRNTDGTWSILRKDDYDVLQSKYEGDSAAQPVAYALVNKRYELFPTPDAVYSVRHYFYGGAASLATNVTNAWLTYARTWFLDTVSAVMFMKYVFNAKMAENYAGSARAAASKIAVADEAARQANLDASMGDD